MSAAATATEAAGVSIVIVGQNRAQISGEINAFAGLEHKARDSCFKHGLPCSLLCRPCSGPLRELRYGASGEGRARRASLPSLWEVHARLKEQSKWAITREIALARSGGSKTILLLILFVVAAPVINPLDNSLEAA